MHAKRQRSRFVMDVIGSVVAVAVSGLVLLLLFSLSSFVWLVSTSVSTFDCSGVVTSSSCSSTCSASSLVDGSFVVVLVVVFVEAVPAMVLNPTDVDVVLALPESKAVPSDTPDCSPTSTRDDEFALDPPSDDRPRRCNDWSRISLLSPGLSLCQNWFMAITP